MRMLLFGIEKWSFEVHEKIPSSNRAILLDWLIHYSFDHSQTRGAPLSSPQHFTACVCVCWRRRRGVILTLISSLYIVRTNRLPPRPQPQFQQSAIHSARFSSLNTVCGPFISTELYSALGVMRASINGPQIGSAAHGTNK